MQELAKGVQNDREVFRNKTDQIFSYQFEDTSHLRLIVLSNSPESSFDLGVELSLFSTVNTRELRKHWKNFAISLGALTFLYIVCLYRNYKRKMDANRYSQMHDELREVPPGEQELKDYLD